MDLIKRYRGSLLGLAVGDALGTTLEFKATGSFRPLADMIGGGPLGLKPGAWTDDTSVTLCLTESLIDCKGFNPVDQLERYLNWYRQEHLSSIGERYDIGNTVREALARFERTPAPYCGPVDPAKAGNGSLMRLAPVILFYASRPREAIEMAADSSRTTHGAREAVDACRYLAALLVGALLGFSKEELLSDHFTPVPGLWQDAPLAPRVAEIAAGSFKHKQPGEIRGTGYVVACLEAALWAFYRSSFYREGALMAVDLGDDADTTGAVFGQLAGAYYGEDGIPEAWRAKIVQREKIESYARKLLALASLPL